jgi:hypothetical protein
MEKLKVFIENYKKWQPLAQYVQRIEAYTDDDPAFIVENSKALIESICKTILRDANEPFENNININQLVSKALKYLGALEQNIKFARALITMAQAMGELRNSFGTVSHGKSIDELDQESPITSATSQFLVSITDNLVCYILRVYHHEHPQRNEPRLGYTDNDEFNAYLDELYEKVLIANNEYLASEVLFNMDPTAYKAELADYKQS